MMFGFSDTYEISEDAIKEEILENLIDDALENIPFTRPVRGLLKKEDYIGRFDRSVEFREHDKFYVEFQLNVV